MENVQIEKTIYGLKSFNNVVDTNFSQLVNNISSTIKTDRIANIDGFFNDYDLLFVDIPPSGSNNSHLGLASRSLEYLGISLEDLQNEIANLRQENVELKNQIIQLSNLNPSELEEL